MDDSVQNMAVDARPKDANPLGKWVRLMPYPLSAAAAYWFTSTEVENSVYNNLQKTRHFREMSAEHNRQLEVAVEKAATEKVPIGAATAQLRKNYTQLLDQEFEKVGLRGFPRKWSFIHESQRNKAIIEGVTVGAIILSAGIAATNSKFIMDLFGIENAGREK